MDKWKDENAKLIKLNKYLSVQLKEAEISIKKEKLNATLKKMIFGTGGIAVGIGIGALLVSLAN